jgi:hypothetical protein
LKQFDAPRAAVFLGCLSLTTLDYTIIHWAGNTDALFIPTYAFIFFKRHNAVVTAAGFCTLVLLHREQAVVLAVVHALIVGIERPHVRVALALVGADHQ